MTTYPESAFTEILQELQKKSLPINHYRNTSGEGRTQAFGIVNRRCLPPDYSRQNWLRPKLFKHLLDFAEKYVDISWNSCTVNQNYRADKHYDKHNRGESIVVAFGDFTGGELEIHEGPLKGLHDVRHRPVKADFSKILHSVRPFEGNRYSLVFYNFWTPRLPRLPPCSVREEKGTYSFYRGNQKITPQTGLEHPLRGRKKGPRIQREETEIVVEFQ